MTTYKIICGRCKGTYIELPEDGQHVDSACGKFHFNRKYMILRNGIVWCNDQGSTFGMVKIKKEKILCGQMTMFR